jgi:hypothetical protein
VDIDRTNPWLLRLLSLYSTMTMTLRRWKIGRWARYTRLSSEWKVSFSGRMYLKGHLNASRNLVSEISRSTWFAEPVRLGFSSLPWGSRIGYLHVLLVFCLQNLTTNHWNRFSRYDWLGWSTSWSRATHDDTGLTNVS